MSAIIIAISLYIRADHGDGPFDPLLTRRGIRYSDQKDRPHNPLFPLFQ